MKKFIFFCLMFICLFFEAKAQVKDNTPAPVINDSLKKDLFESDKILDITLKGNIHQLLNDRSGSSKYYPIILSFRSGDSIETPISINVKTRGHFRLEKTNCTYPPLLLSIEHTRGSSVFPDKSKLKLVMPCRGDQYILHEWLVYKLYNVVTPQSFRARLVKVTLEDSKNKKMPSPFYGIILEEENEMAQRNNCVIVKKKMPPQDTKREPFLRMAVFEYLIGNTDWSVEYLQNIKLIAHDSASVPVPVPYDFDLSGIVDAPYAKPAEELKLGSVHQRRYRGYCVKDMRLFDSTFALYNRLKKKIYDTFTTCSLLDSRYINATTKYLDEFYSTINDPAAAKKQFTYPCLKNGTGNVIIKGLKGE